LPRKGFVIINHSKTIKVTKEPKWLIQQPFKGVGMRWSEPGFNHLLHLRLAWVNGRFD